MHFSFSTTIHSRNSLVIWLGNFNFKLILKVLKYKYMREVRMLMCSAYFSSSLIAPCHWRFLNKFCYVNMYNWCYFPFDWKLLTGSASRMAELSFVAHTEVAAGRCRVSLYRYRKCERLLDSGSCLALTLLHCHDPRPQNPIHLEQLRKNLTVNICSVPFFHSHSYSSSLPMSILISLWGKSKHVLCVV